MPNNTIQYRCTVHRSNETKVQRGRLPFSLLKCSPKKAINNTTNVKLRSATHATNKDKIPQLKVGKRAA